LLRRWFWLLILLLSRLTLLAGNWRGLLLHLLVRLLMRLNRLFRRLFILSIMIDLNDILYCQSLLVLSYINLGDLNHHQKIRGREKMVKDWLILKFNLAEVVLTQLLLLLRVFDKEDQIFTTHPLRIIDS